MTTLNMPVIDMRGTGLRIAQLRKASGKSVKDLQNFFGFATPQAIYKWQHGTAIPTVDNLVALAVIFGVPLDDIIVIDTDTRAQISA
jgi:transcriptional regulator with XRE-family HTH domain